MLIFTLSMVLAVSMILAQRAAADVEVYRDAALADTDSYDWR